MCQTRDEFMKWYQEVVAEPVEAFRKHLATCPDCQEWLLSQRDGLAFGILSASDEDLIRGMGEGKGLD